MKLNIPARLRAPAEVLTVETFALGIAIAAFGCFLVAVGHAPLDVFSEMLGGAFGNRFAWENTLTKAAPLMLTALCTALPARLGMVIIGNEAALLFGGLGAAVAARAFRDVDAFWVLPAMLTLGALFGAAWITLSAMLRQRRGVNETISSLLLYYVGLGVFLFFVEGPLRDPSSLNKPATFPVGAGNMIGSLPDLDVHWGLPIGMLVCVVCYVLMDHSVFGFAARVAGGNLRAAQLGGLGVSRLVYTATAIGGGAAGLAGAIEVSAVHETANATLNNGAGFAGILVAFVARQNPIAIIPVAVLLGGIEASSGLLQRRIGLPDATVDVFKGIILVSILASETFIGRFRSFQPGHESHA
jgi:general nucleoside transport system permease protein